MKFVNVHPASSLSFELGGAKYRVAQGEVVDIPDKFAYAVDAIGLGENLKPYVEPVQETKPKGK